MRFAIMESIVDSGGHEVEWDRQIVEGLQALGHEAVFYLPRDYKLKYDYRIPVNYLPGTGVSYVGAYRLKKFWLSLKREINRLRWYRSLYYQAGQGQFGAVIFPTATYRFLRSLNRSILRYSPVPIIFCVLGVTPEEDLNFFHEAQKLERFHNIKIVVISLADQVLGKNSPNVTCVKPPIFTVKSELYQTGFPDHHKLKIGFFGQYRKEKRLEDLLTAFRNCSFQKPVELVVQTVANKPDDRAALEMLKTKYHNQPGITFFDKAVYGAEWYQVISGMDALVIPYANPRFRYHGSGMLLTAIGLKKPVVIADEVWPELLRDYQIGITYQTGNIAALTSALENFVATHNAQSSTYCEEMARINKDYSPKQFVANLVTVAQQ